MWHREGVKTISFCKLLTFWMNPYCFFHTRSFKFERRDCINTPERKTTRTSESDIWKNPEKLWNLRNFWKFVKTVKIYPRSNRISKILNFDRKTKKTSFVSESLIIPVINVNISLPYRSFFLTLEITYWKQLKNRLQ